MGWGEGGVPSAGSAARPDGLAYGTMPADCTAHGTIPPVTRCIRTYAPCAAGDNRQSDSWRR